MYIRLGTRISVYSKKHKHIQHILGYGWYAGNSDFGELITKGDFWMEINRYHPGWNLKPRTSRGGQSKSYVPHYKTNPKYFKVDADKHFYKIESGIPEVEIQKEPKHHFKSTKTKRSPKSVLVGDMWITAVVKKGKK